MSELMTLQELKLHLAKQSTIYTKGIKNRQYRRAISELREMGIIFIPVADFTYRKIEECTTEQKDKYINQELAKWKTTYFNTLLPIKNHMNDQQLSELHNGGLFNE